MILFKKEIKIYPCRLRVGNFVGVFVGFFVGTGVGALLGRGGVGPSVPVPFVYCRGGSGDNAPKQFFHLALGLHTPFAGLPLHRLVWTPTFLAWLQNLLPRPSEYSWLKTALFCVMNAEYPSHSLY